MIWLFLCLLLGRCLIPALSQRSPYFSRPAKKRIALPTAVCILGTTILPNHLERKFGTFVFSAGCLEVGVLDGSVLLVVGHSNSGSLGNTVGQPRYSRFAVSVGDFRLISYIYLTHGMSLSG